MRLPSFFWEAKPDPFWSLPSTSRPMKRCKDQQIPNCWQGSWLSSTPPIGNTSLSGTGIIILSNSRTPYSALSSTGKSWLLMPQCSMGTRSTMPSCTKNLAPLASMTTDWAVPWRPHCLVTYAFELDDDFRKYNQLRSFPPLPNVPDIGFRAWSTYVSQVEDSSSTRQNQMQGRGALPIGFQSLNSICYNNIHGHHKEEPPTLQSSINHLS